MSTLLRFPSPHEHIAGYRFGRAALFVEAERLLVDDTEVPISPMVFRLLLALCRADGAMLTRNAAFDLLWPGGGSASDEALAQIVRKLRLALGDDGRFLITVRGRGFRLDVPIEPIAAAPRGASIRASPSTTSEASTADATPLPSTDDYQIPVATRRRWPWFVLAAMLVAIASAEWMLRPIDAELSGFAVHVRDFGPISNAGVRTIADALEREGDSDRATATHLLETLIDSEPRSAAAPFLLLYFLGGSIRAQSLPVWEKTFDTRLPPSATPYMQLMARWVRDDELPLSSKLELLNAMLKLEPSAWRVRLARAHVLLDFARYDQTLADLREIPLSKTDPRARMVILSDRASLGDTDAAEHEVQTMAARAPGAAAYVHGRIAMARGDWAGAQASFETAGVAAEREVLAGMLYRAWLLAAVASAQQSDWIHADDLTKAAVRAATEHNLPELLADADALEGYVQHRMGHAEARDALWNRAADSLQPAQRADLQTRLWLVRARIDPVGAAARVPNVENDAPLAALVAARKSWLDCNNDIAAQRLVDAEQAGVDQGYLADDADLLRQDLGLARHAPPAPPRLPYPAPIRWLTYFETAQAPAPLRCAPAQKLTPANR